MELSIAQVSKRLDMTRRQVDYLIKSGRLVAHKRGGRWMIAEEELEHLPTMGTIPPAEHRLPHSVTNLPAFVTARQIAQSLRTALPADHLAHRQLRECLELLTLAYHRQEPLRAGRAWKKARDLASLTACSLLLENDEAAMEIGLRIEMELIPLIRRA